MSKNKVDAVDVLGVLHYHVVSALLSPIAYECGDYLHFGIFFESVVKTIVAFLGGRRTVQPCYLQNSALAVEPARHITRHTESHFVIVGTHKGGVFGGAGLALEYNHRHTAFGSTVYRRRNALHLVRSHDEQVNATFYEAVDLLNLSLAIVVSRCKTEFYALVKIGFHSQLRVLLASPNIIRTLRHPDTVLRRVGSAGGNGGGD